MNKTRLEIVQENRMGGGEEDDNLEEKKVEVEEVNMMKEEGGAEDYEGLLQAKAKGSLWFDQLQRFIAVQTLYSYAVPRIICIGEESSGKSSTLERIAEMSFFPTDRHLCTRIPIELRMRHQNGNVIKEKVGNPNASSYVLMHLIRGPDSKLSDDVNNGPFSAADVAQKVKEWMFSIVESRSQDSGRPVGVTDDRLVIELFSTRKINLDLVDLPGIVAGRTEGEPDDIVEKTRHLTEQYLQEPHTLVVLVVSNRAERIRNSQAFELVQRYQKQKHTVGVLTMVDRCADSRRPHDPFWELEERLNGTSSDLPELGAGYVALKNRDTMISKENPKTSTIYAAHEEELHWFNTHLPKLLTESRACVGLDSLLSKLLSLLHTYTNETWASMEYDRLVRERDRVVSEKLSLGEVLIGDSLDVLLDSISKRGNEFAEDLGSYAVIDKKMEEVVNSLHHEAFVPAPAPAPRPAPLPLGGVPTNSHPSIRGFPAPARGPPAFGGAPRNSNPLPNKWFKSPTAPSSWLNYDTQNSELFYRDKATFYSAITNAVQKSLEELIKTPVERILDNIFLDELPLLLCRFNQLRKGVTYICREWVQKLSTTIKNKLLYWLSLDQVFPKNMAGPCSLFENPSQYLTTLLFNDKEPFRLRNRLVDLIKTELMLNPFHIILSKQSLRVKLNEWWMSLGNEDCDLESQLCQEMQSVTERRELLQSESNALDLMIQTLKEVFPSKFASKNTFVFGMKSENGQPPSNCGFKFSSGTAPGKR